MAKTPIFEPAEVFECPICNGEVTANDAVCPHCGTEFEQEEEEEIQEEKEEAVATRVAPPPPPPGDLSLTHIYEQNSGILSSLEEIHERLDAMVDAQEKLEKDVSDIKTRAAIGKKKDESTRTVFADELQRGDDEDEPVMENVPLPSAPVATRVAPAPTGPATNPTAESKRSTTQIIKDLSKIKGIGESRAEKLAEAGIESIKQVAEMRLTKPIKNLFGGEKRAKEAQKHAQELAKKTR